MKPKFQYALVDGNNFYVSCERVFNARLHGRPVVVLSNNDGCCVARSDEAKALGIRMAQPHFEVRDLLVRNNGAALSSNYELYADMSRRMMTVIGQYAPEQEVYSIDESFLRFQGFHHWDLTAHCTRLRNQVRQWTGIPVGVGVGPTKTLAKLANRLSKRHPDFKVSGVCNLQDIAPWNLIRYLSETAVEDVWGIGRHWGEKLRTLGISSAQDLRMASPELLRSRFGVVMERTARELNGIPCIPLEDAPPPKQQIVTSRSFGHPVTNVEELVEAAASYASRAAEKLRHEGQAANALQVFLATNQFNPSEPQHHPALLIRFPSPTRDTGRLVRAACRGARRLYQRGYRYKKAGVMLLDLQAAGVSQGDLFSRETIESDNTNRLMAALDSVNAQWGRGTLRFAAEGTKQEWRMKRQSQTPSYTTSWDALPLALA